MYSSYCLLFLFLPAYCVSENRIIRLTALMIILSLMTVRLKKEEAGLLRTFGTEYIRYA